MNNNKDQLEAINRSLELLDLDKISLNKQPDFNKMIDCMAAYLNTLIQNDFNKLIAILYRIDVSRQKINTALENNEDGLSAGHILAKLIIERETEKIKTRKKYKDFN